MKRNDDEFEPTTPSRRGTPRPVSRTFVARLMKALGNSNSNALRSGAVSPRQGGGVKRGRGRVPARTAGRGLDHRSRRVMIKTRIVQLKKVGARSVSTHLRYIERDGVSRSGEPGQAYGPDSDSVDLKNFEEIGRGDRHQFRLIVSPEDGVALDDLRTFTRHMMLDIQRDLGTPLQWVAVDHWDTGHPHTHIVLRGRIGKGRKAEDLVINQEYLVEGMRKRACERATLWLGPRTELEIQQSQYREVDQERWTGLDRSLQRFSVDAAVSIQTLNQPECQSIRSALIGRLRQLEVMDLARVVERGTWVLAPHMEDTLRAMGERADIVRTMQRTFGEQQREFFIFNSQSKDSVIGRVAAKGLADELNDRGYLIVDGIDGRAHYIVLPNKQSLDHFPKDGIVEVRGIPDVRLSDQAILERSHSGFYSVNEHRLFARADPLHKDPDRFVLAHARRLEALRKAGIVQRLSDDLWQIPTDLMERGRAYDAKRLIEAAVELKSNLPIERQQRALGVTWLDQQITERVRGVAAVGFGAEVWASLKERADFLIEQGLGKRENGLFTPAREFMSKLRQRDLDRAGALLQKETGIRYRPTRDGQHIAGTYRKSIQLVSGRFAMLDDGMGISLVPWRPVIERQLGQSISGIVRGNDVSWSLGRDRGLSR